MAVPSFMHLGGVYFPEALFTVLFTYSLNSVCILPPRPRADSALPLQPLTRVELSRRARTNDMIRHLDFQSGFLIKRAA